MEQVLLWDHLSPTHRQASRGAARRRSTASGISNRQLVSSGSLKPVRRWASPSENRSAPPVHSEPTELGGIHHGPIWVKTPDSFIGKRSETILASADLKPQGFDPVPVGVGAADPSWRAPPQSSPHRGPGSLHWSRPRGSKPPTVESRHSVRFRRCRVRAEWRERPGTSAHSRCQSYISVAQHTAQMEARWTLTPSFLTCSDHMLWVIRMHASYACVHFTNRSNVSS